MGLMTLQTKWMPSQQSIEPRQSWKSVLFFPHCGTLGDFISNPPPAFGFYLHQVNWKEESGGSWNQAFLDHLGHQASHLPQED